MRLLGVITILCFVMSLNLLAQDEKGDFTWRPYKCTLVPSAEMRQAVRVAEGTENIVRMAADKDQAQTKVINTCASIALRFGLNDSDCYNVDEENLRCRRKWSGYYEF